MADCSGMQTLTFYENDFIYVASSSGQVLSFVIKVQVAFVWHGYEFFLKLNLYSINICNWYEMHRFRYRYNTYTIFAIFSHLAILDDYEQCLFRLVFSPHVYLQPIFRILHFLFPLNNYMVCVWTISVCFTTFSLVFCM